jgi:hypothetical protein
MVGPAAIVLLTPFVFGFCFGPLAIAGLLPGALASGLVMATSQAVNYNLFILSFFLIII